MISSTDNTLLPICTTENEIKVLEIMEKEVTSNQESNSIPNSENWVKEVTEIQDENYTADIQLLDLIESEIMEAGNALQEKNCSIENGVLETTNENNSNRRDLNSSEEHPSNITDTPVSRISKNRLKAKKKRVLGQSYIEYKEFEDGKIAQNCKKSSRSVKQNCDHMNTTKGTSRTFMCKVISEDERNLLFKNFWNFPTWTEKKAFVMGLVSTREI